MGDHFLVSASKLVSVPRDLLNIEPLRRRGNAVDVVSDLRELVPLGALNDIVKDQDHAMVTAFEDQDVLVLGLLVVQDLVDLQDHGLAGPLVGYLPEPAICHQSLGKLRATCIRHGRVCRTFDGGMCDFSHCLRTVMALVL
jgi:hypothetical protein